MSLSVVPLGAGQDVGRSCLVLTLGGKNVLLDCGMHMGYEDARRFPDFGFVGAAGALHEVLDAFARMDVKAAIEVYQEDDRIDREYEAIIRQLMTYMMEDPRSIPNVLQVMWSARSIERVGDRCQNICEYIIYFVKGKDIRHTSQEEIESILK